MLIIGENLNVISRKIGSALKDRDPKPVREMAEAQTAAGVDMIDINLGPARKGGADLMAWVVRTVQEVTDVPLCLATMNVEALEAGLAACTHKALINSISARPERMEALMPLAKRYNAGFIAMTLGVEGIPRDANERGLLAAELLAKAAGTTSPMKIYGSTPLIMPVTRSRPMYGTALSLSPCWPTSPPAANRPAASRTRRTARPTR
jgi:5-methyltetrahydrofolate corrinoid/iron sulfur protein methyltransferase